MNRFFNLDGKARDFLSGGEREGGMEMIQVVFSIAIAVILGTLVFTYVNTVVTPSMDDVNKKTQSLFKSVNSALGSAASNVAP